MQTLLKPVTLPESRSGIRMQTKKILLLEDDEDFRNIIKEFLESHFYNVITVRNGVEGVREIMARYKGDGKVADFVKKVSGTMLNKPFHVDDLLEMIAFVQVRADLSF